MIKSKKFWYLVAIVLTLAVSVFLRFINLDGIPSGLHADEASQGYNAFSLLKTGRDMYGHVLPILFRASGSYQTPVYTYLSIIPVGLFGNRIFAVRFISALSGILLVFLSYLILKFWGKNGLIAAVVVAISPWAVLFSRVAVEANLAVTIFALSIYFFSKSLKEPKNLIIATIFLGVSTHSYYSERVIAILFLPLFVLLFRKIFFKQKRLLIISAIIFAIILIPHIYILQTGALVKRFTQVGYGGNGSILQGVGEFVGHFVSYYSPRNLFFYTGNNLDMTAPELGVFYEWFLIPFLFGIRYLFKARKENFSKLVLLLIAITPIPAALTGNAFYPLRTLDLFWIFSIVISLGVYDLWNLLRYNVIRIPIFLVLLGFSFVSLYISYFILYKYESNGSAYIALNSVLDRYKGENIWIDYSDRAWGEGIRLAYLEKADPGKIQASLSSQQKTPYYSSEVNSGEVFVVNNITVKPLNWSEVCGKMLIIGDVASVSPAQVVEHKLKQEFEVSDVAGIPRLFGYTTSTNCILPNEK